MKDCTEMKRIQLSRSHPSIHPSIQAGLKIHIIFFSRKCIEFIVMNSRKPDTGLFGVGRGLHHLHTRIKKDQPDGCTSNEYKTAPQQQQPTAGMDRDAKFEQLNI